jgi:opacity protein-like surface antigen
MKNKKLTIAMAACAVIALTTNLSAANISPYISAGGGIGSISNSEGDKSVMGFYIAPAVGARIALEDITLRAEGEFSFANHNDLVTEDPGNMYDIWTIDTKIKFATYMANVYADFLTGYRIKSFIGAGIGYASINIKETEYYFDYSASTKNWDYYQGDGNGFVWALYAGFGFNITDGLSLELTGRYVSSKIKNPTFSTIGGGLGLRYTF